MLAALLAIAFAEAAAVAAATQPAADDRPAADEQPIEIQADQFEMLLAERRTTYTGNVVATQGERAITGGVLVVQFDDDNEVSAMHASGDPATLTDHRSGRTLSLSGTTLNYDFDESVVRAEGGGVLSRDGDALAAQTIVYDLDTERARAVGTGSQRVRLTLAPRL